MKSTESINKDYVEGETKKLSSLSRLGEPYWLGSTTQIVLIVAAISMAIWGEIAGFGLLIFLVLTTNVYPLVQLYFTKKAVLKNSPNKDFELRFKDVSHIAVDFKPEVAVKRAANPYFDNMVYLFHGLHYVVLIACFIAVGYMESYLGAGILALCLGLFYAPISESYSHEFVHRRSLFQQMLGGSVWASYCYGTFLPEHCMGHHVNVSTPEDPSSAPKGMTLYQFLPQAIALNTINGFKLEAKRLRDRNVSPWSLRNRLIWLTSFSVLLAVIAWLISGSYGLFFFIAQTIGGITTIEVANYVMHYGLERRKLENGRYERVSPLHSWNREGALNFTVIGLMRHSDHHAFPRRPYQNLRAFPEAPELPLPYELLLYMPYFPKMWFKVMDPSVDLHMNKLAEWRKQGIDDYKMVMNIDGERVKA